MIIFIKKFKCTKQTRNIRFLREGEKHGESKCHKQLCEQYQIHLEKKEETFRTNTS